MTASMPQSTTDLAMGGRILRLGGPYLGLLRESNDIAQDWPALRQRMDEDGYLFIRGLHRRDEVLDARRELLVELAALGNLAADAPLMDGVIAPDRDHATCDQVALARSSLFRRLVTAAPVMDFFAGFLGGQPRTFDFRWLRVTGHGADTAAHMDKVYMGRGTERLYTCWTPLGDIELEQGPLVINVASHRSAGFAELRASYGAIDIDRDRLPGWFGTDPIDIVDRFGGRWATNTFRAGDAVIFGMMTAHGSLTNTSRRFRLSSDTRYQLASEPADERWVGDKPIGSSFLGVSG
jgi:ectoine hydroxylase-related dioxygenase (phytanoyl-CoA dioxygenase family)